MWKVWTVVVAVAGCVQAGTHVGFREPHENLTPDERVATFEAYRGITETTVICTNCLQQETDDRSMRMANGIVVHRADDLVPLVSKYSTTAEHARATTRATWRDLWWTVASGAVVALGTYLWYSAASSKDTPSPKTEERIGIGLVIGGVLASVGAGIYYRVRFNSETHLAYKSFNDDLADRLRVCSDGLLVVPCETLTAPPTPAAPTTPTTKPPHIPAGPVATTQWR
jgi:hypothetical protein